VLEEGVGATLAAPVAAKAVLPALSTISPAELKRALDASACTVFDLRPSMSFRKAHVPGSRWSIRSRLARDAGNVGDVVLVYDDAALARLAAVDLIETGVKNVKLLEGGFNAWTAAGFASESSPATPADADCIDYLFFVHDRHAGNREAMKQYLAWETGLIAQLDEEDRKLFRVGGRG
jgi:rhodanese-related sulfurtransferase